MSGPSDPPGEPAPDYVEVPTWLWMELVDFNRWIFDRLEEVMPMAKEKKLKQRLDRIRLGFHHVAERELKKLDK